MNIGDRVKFKTIGGWYNSGIVEDMDEESCLVKVDKLGYDRGLITLPYYTRILLNSCHMDILPKYEAKVITRGNCMICGKELTEGLFFCKKCEEKAQSRK